MAPDEVASAVRLRLAAQIEAELAPLHGLARKVAELDEHLEREPDSWILAAPSCPWPTFAQR